MVNSMTNGLGRRSSTTLILLGGLAVLFGIVASAWPLTTAISLVVLWGIYALVDGVLAIALAFSAPGAGAKTLLVVSGLVGICAGLLGVFRPITSAVALAWVMGIWLIVRGVLELASAFDQRTSRSRWLLVLGGIFWCIAGVIFVSRPGEAALTVSLWLGIFAIVWGLLLVGAGFALRSETNSSTSL